MPSANTPEDDRFSPSKYYRLVSVFAVAAIIGILKGIAPVLEKGLPLLIDMGLEGIKSRLQPDIICLLLVKTGLLMFVIKYLIDDLFYDDKKPKPEVTWSGLYQRAITWMFLVLATYMSATETNALTPTQVAKSTLLLWSLGLVVCTFFMTFILVRREKTWELLKVLKQRETAYILENILLLILCYFSSSVCLAWILVVFVLFIICLPLHKVLKWLLRKIAEMEGRC